MTSMKKDYQVSQKWPPSTW